MPQEPKKRHGQEQPALRQPGMAFPKRHHQADANKEKTGRHRFFISRQALTNADDYVGTLLRDDLDTDKDQLPGS